ncbi:MAG: hypothetical protein DDT19_01901 [Syntrophomonadaceae bacterium]|nr:hypothetical protein [Bacillota bacterium]
MSWIVKNRRAGPWAFTKQPEKPDYDVGKRIRHRTQPVWDMEFKEEEIASRRHDPCGYWFDSPLGEFFLRGCSPLAIVNENGTPATDTILRSGSLDFRTTGACRETIVWSVSVDVGSTLGGSIITQAGVLTAGATSCGSLRVTANCESCRTSATHFVRVADAGGWVLIASCGMSFWWRGSYCRHTFISGKYRYYTEWCMRVPPVAPETCVTDCVPFFNPGCPSYGMGPCTWINDGFTHKCWTNASSVEEWRC